MIRRIAVNQDLHSLAFQFPERYPHLLASAAQGQKNTRYDILLAFPEGEVTLEASGKISSTYPVEGEDFLHILDQVWRQQAQSIVDAPDEHALPFRGGWFVYLGYELAGQIEPSLQLPLFSYDFPVARAVRCPAAIIRDHQAGCLFIVAEPGRETLLDAMQRDLAAVGEPKSLGLGEALGTHRLHESDPGQFLEAVERIKRYIVEGDIFQVNLSRPWHTDGVGRDAAARLYQSLCRQNPAPFAGLSIQDEGVILSSSPERLVEVRGDRVQTRPIAGTHPRGQTDADDQALSRELLAHPKERAEHIMLIDLERNDLGRVCRPGTIEVDELMVLESYAHVHHIVSNVRGRLRDGATPGDVIRAVFPGGTITGCPKVRCMEIIAELEQEGRGPYTGAMGYLNHNGDMDLNILIRTMFLNQAGLSFRAGGGIVADSVPERELEETRNKARGMKLALERATERDSTQVSE